MDAVYDAMFFLLPPPPPLLSHAIKLSEGRRWHLLLSSSPALLCLSGEDVLWVEGGHISLLFFLVGGWRCEKLGGNLNGSRTR